MISVLRSKLLILTILCGVSGSATASTYSDFLKKVSSSAQNLDKALSQHMCDALIVGKPTVPVEPVKNDMSMMFFEKYAYTPHPAGPLLHHRYNHDAGNKQDAYIFLLEPEFQAEFAQIAREFISHRFPTLKIKIETRRTDNLEIFIGAPSGKNGDILKPGLAIYVIGPEDTLKQLAEVFPSGLQ